MQWESHRGAGSALFRGTGTLWQAVFISVVLLKTPLLLKLLEQVFLNQFFYSFFGFLLLNLSTKRCLKFFNSVSNFSGVRNLCNATSALPFFLHQRPEFPCLERPKKKNLLRWPLIQCTLNDRLSVHEKAVVKADCRLNCWPLKADFIVIFYNKIDVQVARNEVKNASFAQRSAHREGKNMATEIDWNGRRAQATCADVDGRSNRPTPTHRLCHSKIFHWIAPYNVWFFWVGRQRSLILAKK